MSGNGPDIVALQQKSEPYVGLWGYNTIPGFDDKEQLAVGIRDIYTYDTLEDVFTELGFSNGAAISSYIDDVASREYDSVETMRSELDVLSCSTENLHVQVISSPASMSESGTYSLSEIDFAVTCSDNTDYTLQFRFGPSDSLDYSDRLLGYSVSYYSD